MWSIYKPTSPDLERMPTNMPGISHDGTNRVYAMRLENATDPYVLPERDASGEPLSGDQQALLAAVWLFSQTDNAMYLTQQQAIALFDHPAHHLWCATYEEDQHEQFEADYHYVGAFITEIGSAVVWPAFTPELTPAQARQYMLMGLSQIN
ncbi:hypothetical protein [Neptunomonas sp.]|uniref:hypothetical protein n=1 Tax=Neptunomonas sp. TaxID=1971898 RepID=UPI002600397E|nr:hypothetical protein [Neptunomonas sp.]